MLQAVIFYLLAIATVLSGLAVITRRNPIASAVSLVVTFFFLAALYVMLGAHFVAVTQVLVYAGAVMVLFVFVIMLLNLRGTDPRELPDLAPRGLVGLAVAGFIGMGLVVSIDALRLVDMGPVADDFGTIQQVGTIIFDGTYLLPFEVASALLTVAMVGAVVLAKREI
ncbi:MAG: NADH-quinone oxidoreductase subunit J [Deltaproteobacteria bacterium]|nr:MAG: NADH-quinone oxidoreductase subunit J [Deltaproteobacteria bacterium]